MQTANSPQTAKNAEGIDYYEVGRRFEEYIINLFNRDYFTLKDWNKAQRIEDANIPVNLSNPDLTLRLFGRKSYSFAIECKWRSEFKYGDKLRWAEEYQIRNYKMFRKEYNIPVFVAIGVGGSSDKPNELFVTPLHYIENNIIVSRHDLLPYVRVTERKFNYNYKQEKLFQFFAD
jgi:hypothetical protein